MFEKIGAENPESREAIACADKMHAMGAIRNGHRGHSLTFSIANKPKTILSATNDDVFKYLKI